MKTIATVAAALFACTTDTSNEPQPGTGTDPTDPVVVDGAKRVFVTSTVYQGGLLGGLDGADAKCGERATAAGLTGTYKAWLSTDAAAARDRLTHSMDPYTLVDGQTQIAGDWDELVSGAHVNAIDRDESGKPVTGEETCAVVGGLIPAWTGTEYDGSHAADYDCGGWTALQRNGLAGNILATTSKWTSSLCAPSCTSSAALYCIEQ